MKQISHFCTSATLRIIRREVQEFLSLVPLSEEVCFFIVSGVDEACSNILRHAYPKTGKGEIRIRLKRLKKGIRISIRDFGEPCDPEKIGGRDLDDIRPGGLGTHLIRQAFDRVRYFPCKKGTLLLLNKTF